MEKRRRAWDAGDERVRPLLDPPIEIDAGGNEYDEEGCGEQHQAGGNGESGHAENRHPLRSLSLLPTEERNADDPPEIAFVRSFLRISRDIDLALLLPVAGKA